MKNESLWRFLADRADIIRATLGIIGVLSIFFGMIVAIEQLTFFGKAPLDFGIEVVVSGIIMIALGIFLPGEKELLKIKNLDTKEEE